MNNNKEPSLTMISDKAPAVSSHIQDEKYLSAILDILDEEINLLTPNQNTVDPKTDELDLLVADLLKQLTATSDPQ